MKLSELFKTPFKVKGGGVLNLRGFSKRVVDKEIEGGGVEQDDVDVFAKYGCVNVVSTEFSPAPVITYIKMVVGDKNKRVTITPDDFIKYQAEVQNLINSHQEAGDLNSHILANEQVSMDDSNWNITIFDLVPSSLSNIKIDTNVANAIQDTHHYNIPQMPKLQAQKDVMHMSDEIVPVAKELFGVLSPISLEGLCFIAFDYYFGVKKSNKLSMPALYIDIDATPTEDHMIPAKFVWITLENSDTSVS